MCVVLNTPVVRVLYWVSCNQARASCAYQYPVFLLLVAQFNLPINRTAAIKHTLCEVYSLQMNDQSFPCFICLENVQIIVFMLTVVHYYTDVRLNDETTE